MYNIKKNIDRLKTKGSTFFLDPYEVKEISHYLKIKEYNLFKPYIDSEKVILYKNIKPKVTLFKIVTKEKLRHQDIMGSIFSLNIKKEMFGDIIVDDNQYYFYILDSMKDYFLSYFRKVKNVAITLQEIPLDYMENYQRKYLEKSIVVKSNRVDLISSKITGLSRNIIKERIKNKEIIINYQVLSNSSYHFKENDVFSIRCYGKYKYLGVSEKTKKNNYIINYLKYI